MSAASVSHLCQYVCFPTVMAVLGWEKASFLSALPESKCLNEAELKHDTHLCQCVGRSMKVLFFPPLKASQTAQTFQVSQRGCRPDQRKEPYKHPTAPISSWSPSSAAVMSTCTRTPHIRLGTPVAISWLGSLWHRIIMCMCSPTSRSWPT